MPWPSSLHSLPSRLLIYGIEGENFAFKVGLSAKVQRAVQRVSREVATIAGASGTPKEIEEMKAYIVVTAKVGTARDIAHAITGLPGVKMADACWGTGDVYAVVEFPAWAELNSLVMDKIHSMPGVMRTETHVAVEG